MNHFLFPDHKPPMLPDRADVVTACTWLLAVMDSDDNAKKFVASILNYYMGYGYLTEKQMDALRKVCGKIIARFLDGDLQCQGAAPAEKQHLEFNNVIPMKRLSADDVRVIE